MTEKTRNAGKAFLLFFSKKMPIAKCEILIERKSICQACEFWSPEGFRGTGKCTKCGCSTWVKLRMATERCPIGKWQAHLTSPPN
jgi:hypothetical protein